MLKKQFLYFCLVGGVAFFVDVSVFKTAEFFLNNYYLSRIVSYFFTVTFTWYFNKRLTFKSHENGVSNVNALVQWLRFLYTQSFGLIVNYTIFSLLVTFISIFNQYPVLAIAASTAPSLFINFLSAKFFVFDREK